MSEGKLELFYQDGKLYLECDAPQGKVRIAEMAMGHRKDSGQDAAELVLRWNAFEEGGSHKALVGACEEAQKVFGFIAENYKSAPHFPNVERLVEAVLRRERDGY